MGKREISVKNVWNLCSKTMTTHNASKSNFRQFVYLF